MGHHAGIGGVGPLVKVTWWDAAQQIKLHTINAKHPEMHLAVCETVGELVAKDDKAVVVIMHGSQCDGCDIMAIPRDWCQQIEVMEIVGECISESSESQQELPDVITSSNSKKE